MTTTDNRYPEDSKAPQVQCWTGRGYPRLAQLMGAYPEMAVYRKFGTLNHLNALGLQADLIDLEEKYKDCVEDDNQSKDESTRQLSEDFHLHRERKSEQARLLRDEIRPTLREYNECIAQLAALQSLRRPEKHSLATLRGWLSGEQEGNFFLKGLEAFTWDPGQGHDFVTLKCAEDERTAAAKWFNPKLIDLYYWLRPRLKRPKFIDVESGRVYDTNQSTAVRLARVVLRIGATLVASLLPVLAMLVLYNIQTTVARIVTTIGITALFGLCLAAFTNATMKEIYTATAAFAAVEVVFIGSASGS